MTQDELIKKIMAESPNKKCSCGCEHFDRVTLQKEVSSIISPTGKNEIFLAEVLVCRKCSEESKANKIIT